MAAKTKTKIGKHLQRGAKRSVGRPAMGTRHPLLNMGKAYKAQDNWIVVFATEALQFRITQEIVNKSIGRSGRFCVIAQALEKFFGKRYDFQVGAGITKIWDVDARIELRYKTAPIISKAIRVFDTTGQWGLPPNIYKLMKYPKATIENVKAAAKKSREQRHALKAAVLISRKNHAPIVRKPVKKRASATRTVLRNARISWNPPSI